MTIFVRSAFADGTKTIETIRVLEVNPEQIKVILKNPNSDKVTLLLSELKLESVDYISKKSIFKIIFLFVLGNISGLILRGFIFRDMNVKVDPEDFKPIKLDEKLLKSINNIVDSLPKKTDF